MHPHDPQHNPHTRRRLWLIFIVVLVIGIVGIGYRVYASWKLKDETSASAITQVAVIAPKQTTGDEDLILPGNVTAWHDATIYARTNGYLTQWYTPMGTHVKEGDLLADIETPEIDAQLRQAEADVKTAEANNKLAQLTGERWKALLKTDSVSKQEADEKIGDAMAKAAALASAQANRDHLRDLSSFKQVRAPFDGIITSRTTDIGQLINSGSEMQQAPLFHIVQADPLRVYVRVPQNDAGRITPAVKAEVHFADHPGQSFPAEFLKSAEAIDQTSRTLLIEFKLDNKDGKLFAGGYSQVVIKLPALASSLRLPVNTLMFRAAGLQIATVDDQNHTQMHAITMGRDFGNEVEIISGLQPNEKVIVNPPDSLIDHQEVKIIVPEDKKDGDEKTTKEEKKNAKKEDKKQAKEEKKEGIVHIPEKNDKKDATTSDAAKPTANADKPADK